MNRSNSPLAELRARTDDALRELDELAAQRHHEPAADAAMRAVRLTLHTLESFWIPALDHDLNVEPVEPVEPIEEDRV